MSTWFGDPAYFQQWNINETTDITWNTEKNEKHSFVFESGCERAKRERAESVDKFLTLICIKRADELGMSIPGEISYKHMKYSLPSGINLKWMDTNYTNTKFGYVPTIYTNNYTYSNNTIGSTWNLT